MGRITLEDNSNPTEGYSKVATGAYLKTGKITSVEDLSSYPGHEPKFYKSGKQTELCLIVHFIDESFEKLVYLMGNFKRNSKDLISGWDPFLNNVQRLLTKVLGSEAEINEKDLSIPPDVLKKLEGREFQYVNYQSNREYEANDGSTKYSYSVWQKVFSMDEDLETVKEQFAADIPYLKDYAPELVQQKKKEDESFKFGANAAPIEPYDESEGSII